MFALVPLDKYNDNRSLNVITPREEKKTIVCLKSKVPDNTNAIEKERLLLHFNLRKK